MSEIDELRNKANQAETSAWMAMLLACLALYLERIPLPMIADLCR